MTVTSCACDVTAVSVIADAVAAAVLLLLLFALVF